MEKQGMIQFDSISMDFTLDNPAQYELWLQAVAKKESNQIDYLQYVFCTDEELLQYNRNYLNHDYYTDIISFPMSESPIQGDIFISIDRVRDNAKKFETSFHNELLRVMAHGLLHFLGYDDHQKEDIEMMRLKEQEAIQMFNFINKK